MKLSKDELKSLIYKYLFDTESRLENSFIRESNNYNKFVRLNCATEHDLLRLFKAQIKKENFKQTSKDIRRILDFDREI